MPRHVTDYTTVYTPTEPAKRIDEYVGRKNTDDDDVSVAYMRAPSGWSEPGQRPEFDEHVVVLRGTLRVEHEGGVLEVGAGEAVTAFADEWVRYSTPGPDGAEYVAVCRPAFTPERARRDEA